MAVNRTAHNRPSQDKGPNPDAQVAKAKPRASKTKGPGVDINRNRVPTGSGQPYGSDGAGTNNAQPKMNDPGIGKGKQPPTRGAGVKIVKNLPGTSPANRGVEQSGGPIHSKVAGKIVDTTITDGDDGRHGHKGGKFDYYSAAR